MSPPIRITIAPASGERDLAAIRLLFSEYVASLGIDLAFQGFAAELAGLPGRYAPPAGGLWLARDGADDALGCAALRPLDGGACEIKRLYVRPEARGHDLGRRLAQVAIEGARGAGHRVMRLDTLAGMEAAQRLYAALGFRPTAPYYDNPLPGTVYMALDLAGPVAPGVADAPGVG